MFDLLNICARLILRIKGFIMNQAEFENKLFNEAQTILNSKDVIILPTREGYDVISKRKKAFGIIIIGLFGVIYNKGGIHSLQSDRLFKLYDRCRELHSAQDKDLEKTTMKMFYFREQNTALQYLKHFSRKR